MIYFDNSATTLQKPPGVAEAAKEAITTLGNPGRGSYPAAHQAARTVLAARSAVASLAGLSNPMAVAFTSGATESLNLLIGQLFGPEDGIITSVLEHNSVLRPLYKARCQLSFINCDDDGRLQTDQLESLLKSNTRAVVCTHGSNLLGSITDIGAIGAFCARHGLLFLLDAAQTLGCLPLSGTSADFITFTGHKALYGIQGTGGIITAGDGELPLFKTGGTGENSFAHAQKPLMPDALEAGTPNVPGLAALCEGISFIRQTGLEAIGQKETAITTRLLEGLLEVTGIKVYGSHRPENRLPVVALTVKDIDSEDISLCLWEDYHIASRPGSHCAPLAHQRFGTEGCGMVRLSPGYFNTLEEVTKVVNALAAIAGKAAR